MELTPGQSDVRMPVQACTMRDSPNTSYSSFQSGLSTIIEY